MDQQLGASISLCFFVIDVTVYMITLSPLSPRVELLQAARLL